MNDIEKLKYEIQREAIDRAFRESPSHALSKLEELGFCYMEDGGDAEEEREERAATAQTPEQSALVQYFEKGGKPTDFLLQAFIKEKQAENPHYALFRRYFKKGNKPLKALLLYGLSEKPTDLDLLSDLSFMHIFSPMQGELIEAYFSACEKETDPEKFKALARDFYNNATPDGYDAFYVLQERFPDDPEKQAVLSRLQSEKEDDREVSF